MKVCVALEWQKDVFCNLVVYETLDAAKEDLKKAGYTEDVGHIGNRHFKGNSSFLLEEKKVHK